MVQALTTRAVADMTGVPISTLNNWVALKLCRPAVLGPAGKRITRYWHPSDVVIVRTIRALRDAGCPMPILRRVSKTIVEEWKAELPHRALLYDGNDILVLEDDDERFTSGGRQPGQAMFPLSMHVAMIPLTSWMATARGVNTIEVNLSAERRRRREIQTAHNQARRTVSFIG